MAAEDPFNAGPNSNFVPAADPARQAVDSLRGYAYQVLAAGLAWLDIGEQEFLFLEVAEDYSIVAEGVLSGVQVKDTAGSGTITLNSPNVHEAISAFIDLKNRNPSVDVELHFFSTSSIGKERETADRPAGTPGLEYWRKAARSGEVAPLRALLESGKFSEQIRGFVSGKDDDALRNDLLRRIHWDCGKPDFMGLREEFEQRTIVICRDRFNIPTAEARRLVDSIVYAVLKASVLKPPSKRRLNRADLYELIDQSTRLSVQRSSLEALLKLAAGFSGSVTGGAAVSEVVAAERDAWLVRSIDLPVQRQLINRMALKSALTTALDDAAACFIHGGTGLGKSQEARAVAASRVGGFVMVDFRDAEIDETLRRLDMTFARMGGLPAHALILEDLNRIDNDRVARSFARLAEAARRHDREVLVTSYMAPSAEVLASAGLDNRSVVQCTYFTEGETSSLVEIYGGDPGVWGRLAHVAGAGGHPQLTHTFVRGMATRGWPRTEIRTVLESGISSDDIEELREHARQRLAMELPTEQREMLYRLSLTSGRFTRALALTVGSLAPPLPRPGEQLDSLIGPWIETVGKNLFRLSPLARTSGTSVLPPAQQVMIHETIAVEMVKRRSLTPADADAVLMHGLLGHSSWSLIAIANSVLTAGEDTIRMLAEQLMVLPLLHVEHPPFIENPTISIILRLAQFKLVAAIERPETAEVLAALIQELDALEEQGEIRDATHAMVLSVILATMGVANHLDNWVALLVKFTTLVADDEFLSSLKGNVERNNGSKATLESMLFGIGSAGLASVERLENIIIQLDAVEREARLRLLAPLMDSSADYSVLVSAPWVRQHSSENLDATDAATRYDRMAHRTAGWGIRPLTIQFWVARAVMFDEYLDARDRALAIIDEAVSILGDDIQFSRARAKILWRANRHAEALCILRDIADDIGVDNPVERAFALREAAISAAKCNDWPQAQVWFREASNASRRAQTKDMLLMTIGLDADSAVAALECGEVQESLRQMIAAVEALPQSDPNGSLRAAYLHRVIRHSVLWIQSRIDGRPLKVGAERIAMAPGACSNPEPTDIQGPLGPLDFVWYMLAECELAAGLKIGLADSLSTRLTGGPILMMEIGFRIRRLHAEVAGLDAERFALDLVPALEAILALASDGGRLQGNFNVTDPERGIPRAIDPERLTDTALLATANSAVTAFWLSAALSGDSEAIPKLRAALIDKFGQRFPGEEALRTQLLASTSLSELECTVIQAARIVLDDGDPGIFEVWSIGLRWFEWLDRSDYQNHLMPRLAKWLRITWTGLVENQLFRFWNPRRTARAVLETLQCAENDRSFIAALLLASCDAIGASLSVDYRNLLMAIAREADRSKV